MKTFLEYSSVKATDGSHIDEDGNMMDLSDDSVVEKLNAFVGSIGMKEYLNEFERIRYQRISAEVHDPNDSIISVGKAANIKSRNPSRRGYAPDPFFVSHGKVKDSVELELFARINIVLNLVFILIFKTTA